MVSTSIMSGRSSSFTEDSKRRAHANVSFAPERKSPLPSGLSALIQAATAQLGHLAEEAEQGRFRDGEAHSGASSDDGMSSDGGERLDAPSLTPTMVPEPDPSKQSFPELLMTLAIDPNNADIIAFLPDGKFFAIRPQDFTDQIMLHYFAVTSFEEFLELIQEWGFSRIHQDQDPKEELDIEVFRHPKFVRGEWKRCSEIKFGESPTDARLSALPGGVRIDYSVLDDSYNSKRRLSPGSIKRRESESSALSLHKKRLSIDSNFQPPNLGKAGDAESGDHSSYTNQSRSDEVRSVALALTTEKLNLRNDPSAKRSSTSTTNYVPLVDQALKTATHLIVTDAIETLLNDEVHTKETYLKHEKELSKSALPGVIPISKQLFETKSEASNQPLPKEITTLKQSPSADSERLGGIVETSSSDVSPNLTSQPTPALDVIASSATSSGSAPSAIAS